MKKDIEHVVTSTAMFLIAYLVATTPDPPQPRRRRRVRAAAPGVAWITGVALLIGMLSWTTTSYLDHLALCAHFKLQPPPLAMIKSSVPRPPGLEYVDLTALGLEAILLTAFVFFAVRAIRRRRAPRSG